MSRYAFRLPDLGEGTVSAELVAWRVALGDAVEEGQPIAEVSTDKAVVEIPSPVSGRVLSLAGQPGDSIAVGADLIAFEQSDASIAAPSMPAAPQSAAAAAVTAPSARVRTSPAVRRRAREAGIDLASVRGTGPEGRIRAQDLTQALESRPPGTRSQWLQEPAAAAGPAATRAPAAPQALRAEEASEEIRILGVRRVIAERMSAAKRTIPHFSYVEEVDVSELEALREHWNSRHSDAPRLSILPFIAVALVRTLREFPQCNAHYDAAREVLVRYRHVHLGLATQTPDGLKVPVVRHAEARTLQDLAAEMRRVAEAARSKQANASLFSGSTITITSLGKLGGIASTPIVNAPEVAIIGVNRTVERPVVRERAVVVRTMMNLSSSFDHRFVDGHEAASMIQALRERLEHPAMIFAP